MRLWSILVGIIVVLAANTQAQGGALNEIRCFFEVPESAKMDEDILCAFVTVPKDPQQPDGGTIRLPVTIFRSTASTPELEPLVLNTGGPASSGIDSVGQLAFTPFGDAVRSERDIIVVEQRGTRYTDTPLFCQRVADLVFETAGGQVDETVYREALAPCVTAWREQGVNLETYTTATLAADIVATVEALGYKQFIYYGVSYGTLTGQVLMENYPNRLRGVILDSSAPLSINFWLPVNENIERALTAIVTACQEDTFCNESYPNVAEDFFSTLERLNNNPLTLNLVDDETGEATTVSFNGDDYGALIVGMLYTELSIQIIPSTIFYANNPLFTQAILEALVPLFSLTQNTINDSAFYNGLYATVNCADNSDFSLEDVAQSDPELAEGLGSFLLSCDVLGIDYVGTFDRELVRSDVPTLVLSGEFDPVTPPVWGDLIASELPNSFAYTFPTGHGVIASECPQAIVLGFLNNPDSESDTSCLDDMNVEFLDVLQLSEGG